MVTTTLAERTAAEPAPDQVTMKVDAKAATAAAEREPESEEGTATSSPSSSTGVLLEEEEDTELKCDEPALAEDDGDVEMECDETGFGPSDDEEEEDTHQRPRGFASSPYYKSEATPVREYPDEYAKYQIPEKHAVMLSSGMALSPMWGGKRKRSADDAIGGSASRGSIDGGKTPPGSTKVRKGSSDFLRKGQWTPTEERLARLLIEAFEEGYLPIYTGIRLRGYLAVQLQCDPMRISKKLCAGIIDGKRIPKNYGQKKFRLRKKLLWDREEAGRILATLERLSKELWCETGIAPPKYLTLSTTRNADDDMSPTPPSTAGRTQPSPVKKLSPPANKSKKQKSGVVFPIIYLNLSKKLKQGQSSCSTTSPTGHAGLSAVMRQYGIDTPYVQNTDGSIQVMGFAAHSKDSDASSTSSHDGHAVKVDGESLQAAYELLHLHKHCSSPSGSSRSSTPIETTPKPADEGHHTPKQQQEPQVQAEEEKPQSQLNVSVACPMPDLPGVVPIRPAPAKPTILRQQASAVSS